MTCTSCGTKVNESSRYCSSCGSPVSAADEATRTFAAGRTPTSATRSRLSSTAAGEGHFAPGTMLAGRYRIVALLGQGGMGEVYRADDLTLGQTVALKFLPAAMAQNDSALARFYNEVRIARQVSHPNVCRVYDLGEFGGQPYLSMEYVDGEDLGSLLRRIGRLPADKAVEIARKLCAGLAAAHDKGVLHRDLKPSNIMLDGRGQVLITDFGLAAVAEQVQGAEVRNGTPAYMAPEQLAGREVTVASDIYSLGLVLYEIFTGKRAFEAPTMAELVRQQTQSRPASMTTMVRDLDPDIEHAILRCLDPEPRSRPPSALAVAAGLPGGDPLAAALAAGETPSPQMVAAAGESAGMSPRAAIAGLAVVILGLLGVALLSGTSNMVSRAEMDLPPDVLRAKATDLLKQVGHPGRPRDWAQGFLYANSFLDYVRKNDKPRPDWNQIVRGQPAPIRYWYRQHREELLAWSIVNQSRAVGGVTRSDPPMSEPGMMDVLLDSQGRLVSLLAIPPEREQPPGKPQPFDWSIALKAAGLDPASLKPAEPEWNSLAASDTRAAWVGTFPGPAKRPLRVEAAAWRGKLVYFSTIGPWTKPAEESTPTSAGVIVILSVGAALISLALFLSWRNYSTGRSDVRGALRLALFIFGIMMGVWVLGGHHVASAAMFAMFIVAVGHALFIAALVWVLYLALEPFARRRWPQTLISWSRMLGGRVRDPLVGRDILYGMVLAMIWALVFAIRQPIVQRLGGGPERVWLDHLAGLGSSLAAWLFHIRSAVQGVLVFFFLLFSLRVLLRKQWLAVIAFAVMFTAVQNLQPEYPMIDIPVSLLVYVIAGIFLTRFGLVTLATGVFTVDVLLSAPLTLDASAWYFNTSLAILLSFVAIAIFAFHTALAGRPLLKQDWFS